MESEYVDDRKLVGFHRLGTTKNISDIYAVRVGSQHCYKEASLLLTIESRIEGETWDNLWLCCELRLTPSDARLLAQHLIDEAARFESVGCMNDGAD